MKSWIEEGIGLALGLFLIIVLVVVPMFILFMVQLYFLLPLLHFKWGTLLAALIASFATLVEMAFYCSYLDYKGVFNLI